MKQPLIVAGGRRWHGDELVNFHTDALQAAEAVSSSAGAVVLSGCAISGTGPYTIAAGVVGINHSTDGYKIVRFAGGSASSFPVYLAVQKTVTNKVYDDLLSKNAQAEYVALLYTSAPGLPYLTITAAGGKPLAQGLLDSQVTNLLTTSGAFSTGGNTFSLTVDYNKAMNALIIKGSVTVSATITDPPIFFALGSPLSVAPSSDRYFCAQVPHHGSYPVYDVNGAAFTTLVCRVLASGYVGILPRRPGSGNYTAYFNEIVPL